MRKIYLVLFLIFSICALNSHSAYAGVTYTCQTSGTWTVSANWNPNGIPGVNDTAIIPATYTVTMNTAASINKMTVNGVLNKAGSNISMGGDVTIGATGEIKGGGTMTFQGNLTVSTGGKLNTSGSVNFSGSGKTVSGGGTFANVQYTFSNNTTIASDVTLSLSNSVNISSGKTVTNKGTVTLTNSTPIVNAVCTWTNDGSAGAGTGNLILSGTLGASIVLNASSANNTVKYSGTGSYVIKNPSASNYYNLTIQGGSNSIKTLPATITVQNLTIAASTSLDASATPYSINVKGDWSNSGTFNARTGTVTFNGTAAQAIGGSSTTFFNLAVTNTAAAVSVNVNTNVSGTLNMNGSATLLSPGSSVVLNSGAAAGTITGTGTVQVTRTAATADFVNQYKFITNTLTGLTVDYTGNGAQTINSAVGNYGGLKTSTGGTKTLDGAVTVNGAVTVGASSTLDVSASNYALNVGGDWTNDGTFTQRTGTVTFNGASSSQLISGGAASITFNNLALANAFGVTTSIPLSIVDSVVVSSGTFTTNAVAITLLSTAGATARIGNSAGNISGSNWIMQRYIPGSSGNWDDIASTASDNNISDWDNELYLSIAANCPDGMAGGWSSVYYYDETSQSWTAVSSCAQNLSSARGYELWLATSSSSFSATTLDSRGTPVVGDLSAALGTNGSDWALVGNPYASGIDWSRVYPDAQGLTNFFSIYDEQLNDYAVYDGASPGSSTGQLASSGGVICSGQGFWVQNDNSGTYSLNFHESHKTNINKALVKMAAPALPKDVLKMKLHSAMMRNACEAIIKISGEGAEKFNPVTDFAFRKSKDSLTPSLTPLTADGIRTRIRTIPQKASLSVPVTAAFAVAGEYTIDLKGISTIYKYKRISLEDTEAGVIVPLTADRSYTFTHKDTSRTRKFILHFSNPENLAAVTTAAIGESVQAYSSNESIGVNFYFSQVTPTHIEVYNAVGQQVYSQQVNAGYENIQLPVASSSQVYFVKFTTDSGTVTRKVFH